MRYWLVGVFFVGLIAGCSGDDGGTSDNQSDEAVVNDAGDASSGEGNINYNQMSCSDDLTRVVALINELRSQQQTCGNERYGPVDTLTWNALLTEAAQVHSNNMANYDFFSHKGLDESSVATRVTAQGYTWSYVAENIAGGQTTAQSVVDGWMSSDGHCKNIMSENVTEMGLACSANSDASYHYYWTQVFAKAR